VRWAPDWPRAEPIETSRLTLEPLSVEHAGEMLAVLADPRLYEYTGGGPLTLDQLRARYARQVVGHSRDGTQGWLNWILREPALSAVVGTVQATLVHANGAVSAELAWIISVAHQRRGYATEAAEAIAQWLGRRGVRSFVAHIHPDHQASIAVARRLGLSPTDEVSDGETRWVSGGG
jgi:RimJ/RimL family protein N-acetyltransferase